MVQGSTNKEQKKKRGFVMNCYYIIGLRVDHRRSNALNLQKALTEFGCNIRLRVGLHETSEEFCSDDGVIMLQA